MCRQPDRQAHPLRRNCPDRRRFLPPHRVQRKASEVKSTADKKNAEGQNMTEINRQVDRILGLYCRLPETPRRHRKLDRDTATVRIETTPPISRSKPPSYWRSSAGYNEIKPRAAPLHWAGRLLSTGPRGSPRTRHSRGKRRKEALSHLRLRHELGGVVAPSLYRNGCLPLRTHLPKLLQPHT